MCVFGVQGEALERLILGAAAETADSAHQPVFVTDELDTSLFLKHRVPVESVAYAAAWSRAPGTAAYVHHGLRRIRTRWQPLAVLSIGRQPPADWLTLLRGG